MSMPSAKPIPSAASRPPLTEKGALLRKTAYSFCESLLKPPAPSALISEYFVPFYPRITEHGPSWATSRLPFLGKTFIGYRGCEEYFIKLSKTLEMNMSKDTFPSIDGFVVDAEAEVEWMEYKTKKKGKGVVSVVGQATFKSVKTGKEWHEEFIYRFSAFDDKGKIGHWEIWADPLSAWVAVGEN